jgi:hypothetical protein
MLRPGRGRDQGERPRSPCAVTDAGAGRLCCAVLQCRPQVKGMQDEALARAGPPAPDDESGACGIGCRRHRIIARSEIGGVDRSGRSLMRGTGQGRLRIVAAMSTMLAMSTGCVINAPGASPSSVVSPPSQRSAPAVPGAPSARRQGNRGSRCQGADNERSTGVRLPGRCFRQSRSQKSQNYPVGAVAAGAARGDRYRPAIPTGRARAVPCRLRGVGRIGGRSDLSPLHGGKP